MKFKRILVLALSAACISSQALPVKADVETEAQIYQIAKMLDDCIEKNSNEQQKKVCVKRFLRPPQVKANSYATWDYLVLEAYYITNVNSCKSGIIGSRRQLGSLMYEVADSVKELCISSTKYAVLEYAAYVNSPAYDLLSVELPD